MDKPKIDLKPKTNPLLADLPEHLKNPANFEKIQKAILDTFKSTCDHSDILEWGNCPKCTEKMLERRLLLRKLGFKRPSQYFLWRKTHEEIKKRFPLVKWDELNKIRLLENLK